MCPFPQEPSANSQSASYSSHIRGTPCLVSQCQLTSVPVIHKPAHHTSASRVGRFQGPLPRETLSAYTVSVAHVWSTLMCPLPTYVPLGCLPTSVTFLYLSSFTLHLLPLSLCPHCCRPKHTQISGHTSVPHPGLGDPCVPTAWRWVHSQQCSRSQPRAMG